MKKSTPKSSKPATKHGTISRLPGTQTRIETAAERLAAEGVDLAHVMSELEQMSTLNASRVVKLHDRIAAGEYVIDAERVAQKMLDFEAKLND